MREICPLVQFTRYEYKFTIKCKKSLKIPKG